MSRVWSNLFGALAGLRFLPLRWQAPCLLALGTLAGAGLLVVHISRATSYLSDEPETCMNCHVMATQYVTWQHSSHAAVATCNDCHVPHDSVPAHWGFKAKDGLWHATVFTLRREPQVIRLSQGAIPVVEANCCRCHAELLAEVRPSCADRADRRCWDCHREVPHGAVRSLAAVPGPLRPRLRPTGQPDRQPEIGGRPARIHKESSHD